VIVSPPLLRAAAWVVLLSGCASPVVLPTDLGPPISGRLSVRVDAQPVRVLSAGFELSGDARAGVLALTSPLGSTLARAHWSAHEAVLTTPAGQSRFSNLDDLAAQALGEHVPMAALFDWLRGRPWAGATSTALSDGETGFEQLGWRVSLTRFGDGWLDARRDAAPAVTLRARLEPNTATSP
jgi:outer membrane lipoprotein LolB